MNIGQLYQNHIFFILLNRLLTKIKQKTSALSSSNEVSC